MRKLRRTIAAGMMVVLLTLTGCSTGTDAAVYGGSFTFTSPGGKFEFSYPAADRKQIGPLSGPDLTGEKTINLADFHGKVVVLNFWGSWCSPCREEADGLQYSWQTYQSQPVQFVGVNIKDSRSGALAFTASKKITYPSIFDPSMRTILSLRGLPTGSMPVTVVLDKQGRVAHIWLLPITQANLDDILPKLVNEK